MRSKAKQIFLVGMPRSGTKLLRSLMNGHSEISILDIETEFLPYWCHTLGKYGDLSRYKNFERFYASTIRLPYFLYRADQKRLIAISRWYNACRTYDVAGIFEGLVRCDGDAEKESIIWGDKSPSYINHIGLIKKIYPEARIIHIVRDVRDYCLSIRNAWNKNIFRAAQRWNEGVLAAHSDAKPYSEDVLVVRFEDLLELPEQTLEKVCLFLGVTFEPKMMQLEKPSENIGAAKGETTIVAGNKNKYIDFFAKKDLNRIESLASMGLRAFGYSLVNSNVTAETMGRFELISAKLSDGINLVRFEAKSRGLVKAMLFHVRYARSSGNRFV